MNDEDSDEDFNYNTKIDETNQMLLKMSKEEASSK